MSDNTLDFKINGNRHMDILPGVHGSFINRENRLFEGGITHTVLSDYGEILYHAIPTQYGNIWLSKYLIYHTAHLSAEADAPSLEAMHLLKGNVSFSPEGIADPVVMKNAHWQMMYLPHVQNEVTLPAGTKITTLDIHFDMRYLEKLAPYFSELDIFLNEAAAGRPAMLNKTALPISRHMKSLIAGLFNARSSLKSQGLFLDRYLMDWLASGLEASPTGAPIALPIHKHEVDILTEVRNYMQAHFGKPMLISGLAMMALMNEFKFRCLFKTLFKKTPYQFLMNEKMNRARDMLEKGELSLNEIGIACGYDSYPAFSKAFKKRFGISPSYYLKQ